MLAGTAHLNGKATCCLEELVGSSKPHLSPRHLVGYSND